MEIWTEASQAPLVHGILQAGILEWVAMPSSRGSSRSRDQTCVFQVSCVGRRIFTTNTIWEAEREHAKVIAIFMLRALECLECKFSGSINNHCN